MHPSRSAGPKPKPVKGYPLATLTFNYVRVVVTQTKGSRMKINKAEAQRAKDKARSEKQVLLGQTKKNLSTKDKARIASLNAVIEAADKIIEGK